MPPHRHPVLGQEAVVLILIQPFQRGLRGTKERVNFLANANSRWIVNSWCNTNGGMISSVPVRHIRLYIFVVFTQQHEERDSV